MFIIKIFHRSDTSYRKHYPASKGLLNLQPRLLYAGHSVKKHGWSEDMHSHSFCEILFITGGHGSVNIEGNSMPVRKGDVIVYNSHCRHAEESSPHSPLEFFFCAFDSFTLSDFPPCSLTRDAFCHLICNGSMYDVLHDRFRTLIREQRCSELFHNEISFSISREILLYILRITSVSKEEKKDLYEHHILKRATSYLKENFAENLSLEKIAAECFVSKFYLAHLFKSHKGMTIGEYLRSLRLKKAKHLLRTSDEAVNEIAFSCGFHDTQYFYRVFKAQTGLTPTEYRKKTRDNDKSHHLS